MTADAIRALTVPGSHTRGSVLRAALRGQARGLGLSAALYMSWQVCESLVPVLIGVVIDDAITPRDGAAMLRWLVVLLVLFLVLSTSFRYGSRTGTAAAERAAHTLRVQVAGAVLDPLAAPDPSTRTGTVVSVAGSDTERIGRFCLMLPYLAGAATSVVVAAVVVLRIDVVLGLVVLIGGPVLIALMQLLGRPLERRAGVEQASAADASALATDLVAGLRVLQGIGGAPAAVARYRSASRRSLDATLRSARAEGAFETVTLLLPLLFLAVVTLMGGRLAADGRIEIGELVAAGGVAQFLLGPFGRLSELGATLARARASATRIAGVLNTPRYPCPATPSAGAVVPARGALAMPLPAGDRLEVPAGALVGVVADGSDASRVLARLSTPRNSGVRIDGVAVADLDASTAAHTLLVAQHDATLFAQSLHDNVSGAGAPDHAVRSALIAADADEVACSLPDGAATVLGDRARTLSGGQGQRVTLARALAADPIVLVLHDPTTAVDGVTEARIADGLRTVRRDRTTIVLTTSPALLAVCDRVVVVRDGAMVAEGNHSQLADTDPRYAELVLT